MLQSINTDTKEESKISEAETGILPGPVRLLQGKDRYGTRCSTALTSTYISKILTYLISSLTLLSFLNTEAKSLNKLENRDLKDIDV